MQLRPARPWLFATCLILLGSHAAFHLFRVSAWTDLENYEWLSLVVALTCFAAGLASLTISLPSSRSHEAPASWSENSPAAPSLVLRLRPRFHRFPSFGFTTSVMLSLVIVSIWIMQFGDLPSKGLAWTLSGMVSHHKPPGGPKP